MKGDIYPTQYGYQVRFGEEICRHFTDLTAAERTLTYYRHLEDTGQFDPRDHQIKANPLGFKRLSDKWLSLKKKQIKPRSYANLDNYMAQAVEFFGADTNVKLIQYGQLEDFLFTRKVKDKTRSNMKSCLHDFFKWVKKRERIPMPEFPDTPFELGWRNIIDIKTQQRIINEVRAISYHINPKIWFGILSLATYIQIRPSELINLQEKHVDLELGALVIPHPKEKRPKVVYLMEDDVLFLQALPRGLPDLYFFRHPPGLKGAKAGQRFGNRYLYKYWRKACDTLGIQGIDLYGGTRHSTATALGQICTPEEVKDATGHTSKA
ncbi:MAG: hypothetical protein ACYS1A_19345, partial [Planctomycetota bacterium]